MRTSYDNVDVVSKWAFVLTVEECIFKAGKINDFISRCNKSSHFQKLHMDSVAT